MNDGALNLVANTFNDCETFHIGLTINFNLIKKIAEFLFTNTLKFYKRNTD